MPPNSSPLSRRSLAPQCSWLAWPNCAIPGTCKPCGGVQKHQQSRHSRTYRRGKFVLEGGRGQRSPRGQRSTDRGPRPSRRRRVERSTARSARDSAQDRAGARADRAGQSGQGRSSTRILMWGARLPGAAPDGRVLIGSTEEHAGFDKHTTAAGVGDLLALGVKLVPALAGSALERTWAGLRPGSADGLPFIGPAPGIENLYIAAGHFRAGIQLSPGTALLLKEMILEPAAVDADGGVSSGSLALFSPRRTRRKNTSDGRMRLPSRLGNLENDRPSKSTVVYFSAFSAFSAASNSAYSRFGFSMEQLAVRSLTSQSAEDLAWLEEHARAQRGACRAGGGDCVMRRRWSAT